MKTLPLEAIRKLEESAHLALKSGEPSLMEKASRRCAELIFAFQQKHKALAEYPFVVLAGRGNNGGDGILCAAYLNLFYSCKVSVYSLQSPAEMSPEIRCHFCNLPPDVKFRCVKKITDLPDLKSPCIIIDALLGIGFAGELRSLMKEIIEKVNNSGNPVVSIDIPSGIECDSGRGPDGVFADLTITVGAEKKGLYLSDGRIHSGKVQFADIGFDYSKFSAGESEFEIIHKEALKHIFNRKKFEPYKNNNGRLLIAGGSELYPGAVVLAINGANAAGCGLLTAVIKKRPFSFLPSNVIVRDFSMPGEKNFTAADGEKLKVLAMEQDCIVFGPGVTANSDIAEVLKILLALPGKMVLDADALNTIAMFPEIWKYKSHSNIVITPHPGEAKRLAQAFKIDNFEKLMRHEQVKFLAQKMQCTVVLKGDKTLTASPDGRIMVNPAGSYALSKGGSGDILSGVIGALLAGNSTVDITELAAAGVFLHSSGADHIAQSRSAFDINLLPQGIGSFIDSITIF